MTILLTFVFPVLSIMLGISWFYWLKRYQTRLVSESYEQSKRIIREAKEAARLKKKGTSSGGLQPQRELLVTLQVQADKCRDLEAQLSRREEHIATRLSILQQREQNQQLRVCELESQQRNLDRLEGESKHLMTQLRGKLEKASGMSYQRLLQERETFLVSEHEHELAKMFRALDVGVRENAEKLGKRVIDVAMQRLDGDAVLDHPALVVKLPKKGKARFLGRDLKNMALLEEMTSLTLKLDDQEQAILIQGADPVKREIGRLLLTQLVREGNVYETRARKVLRDVEQRLQRTVRKDGQRAMTQLGLSRVHPAIMDMVGRLKYRYSYSQNVYYHSIEMAYLSGCLASEVGENVLSARRAALLHDIGKVILREGEGRHAVVGAEFAAKYGEAPEIVHAIGAHHDDEKPETVLADLVKASDALSGARPGARIEAVENYVQRLQDLEEIAYSFPEISYAFAIQAGRELRAFVGSDKVSERKALELSKSIAGKIQEELVYPGQIKVMVIREMRSVSMAH